MDLGALRRTLRSRIDDVAQPYLWSDAELTAYLNEAASQAAERARLILDGTSPLTRIVVRAGVAVYPLSKKIIEVDTVILNSTGMPLEVTNTNELDRGDRKFIDPQDYYHVGGGEPWRRRTGRPRAYLPEVGFIQLFPIPTEDDSLTVRAYRTPIEDMVAEGDVPEFADRYHFRMIDWAEHLAYLKQDEDTYDANKADAAAKRFTDYFGELPDANVQRKQNAKRVVTCKPRW